jgi:hypothetical protein
VALSNRRHNNNPIYHTDTQLGEKLSTSMISIFEENEDKLRNLKDVKTLMDMYKTTGEYKHQVKKQGILSLIINKFTEELLDQIEPYYTSSIVKDVQIQTQLKREKGTVELNAKINLKASLKPYVEFTIEINGKRSFLIRFTFLIETSAHVTKLKFTKNADEGESIHIEKIGVNIELFLLQIEFSDLSTSSLDISLDKKMKLGSKSFEIHDLSLYSKQSDNLKKTIACSKCNTINSLQAKVCSNCSSSL